MLHCGFLTHFSTLATVVAFPDVPRNPDVGKLVCSNLKRCNLYFHTYAFL